MRANGIGYGSTEFFVLRPKSCLDPNYLFRFLQQKDFRERAARSMTGAVGLRRVPKSFLEEQSIPLPSIDEQQNVVKEIETQFSRLDAGAAALRRVQTNLKRYRASVLKAACEGRLVETEAEVAKREGRTFETGTQLLQRICDERSKAFVLKQKTVGKGKKNYCEAKEAKNVNEVKLPVGWELASLDQLAVVGTGATPKRGNAKFYDGGSTAWVTSGAVNDRVVDAAAEFVTDTALAECNLTLYPAGTLLLAMYGEGKTRGMVSELRIDATTNQALAGIQPVPAVKAFLRLVLERNYQEVRNASSGGVQPNLNLGIVRTIPVPLPPVSEQKRIIAEAERRLSFVEEMESVIAANLRRALRMRQAVLGQAFENNSHVSNTF